MSRRKLPKLRVPVEPLPEASWERLERRLGAARAADAEAAADVDLRRWSRRLGYATLLATGVAAGMLAMWIRRAPDAPPAPAERPPAVVTTLPGGGGRLQLGDALVELGGDTAVSARVTPDGAVTVELVRGAVECDVEPRAGRPPFRVVAGDVEVSVVGTRFAVERGPDGVRVSVVRGRVRVASPRGDAQVDAGQAWEPTRGLVAVAAAPPAAPPPPSAAPRRAPPAPGNATQPTAAEPPAAAGAPSEALAAAEALEGSDPAEAADRYRELGRATDATGETATWRLARLELARGRIDASIAAAEDYERRFPRGPHLEDVLWLRAEAHCAAWRSAAADAAARAYLQRFPGGQHAETARAPSVCRALER